MSTRTDRQISGRTSKRVNRRLTAVAFLPFALMGMAACSEEEADPDTPGQIANGSDVGPFSGVYDSDFREDIPSYLGSEVWLSAEVGELLGEEAFTIVDADAEPLLVLTGAGTPGLQAGQTLGVNGVVREGLDVPALETELGVDLDEEVFLDWEGEYYIFATEIDTDL